MARFCGIFTAHHTDEAPVGDERIISQYGVGVMPVSDHIRLAFTTDEAKQQRRELDAAFEARQVAGRPPLEQAGAAEPTKFERFEDFTRKLVNTPKPKRGE